MKAQIAVMFAMRTGLKLKTIRYGSTVKWYFRKKQTSSWMCKTEAVTLPSNVKQQSIDQTKPKSYPIVSV